MEGAFKDPLPEPLVTGLFSLLEARDLAQLRRACRLGSNAAEGRVAELRAAVLHFLIETQFPFTHNAYVLGLNGSYYSLDTAAGKHYGIPKWLPVLICRLFRSEVPDFPFTSLRIQKFAAAGNFQGRHRTLAFSISSSPGPEVGHLLCLSNRAFGGFGECSLDDEGLGPWRLLTAPAERPRWVKFPTLSWLRWHWPSQGAIYAITASCERTEDVTEIRRREYDALCQLGFAVPDWLESRILDEDQADSADANMGVAQANAEDGAVDARQPEFEATADGRTGVTRVVVRPSLRRIQEAMRILNLEHLEPSLVEQAFRDAVRLAHPDRAAENGMEGRGAAWRMTQIMWARRVLRQSLEAGGGIEDINPGVAPEVSVAGFHLDDDANMELPALPEPMEE